MTRTDPTVKMAAALQTAFDFFNAELFDDRLPQALLTVQRDKAKAFGYYVNSIWADAAPDAPTIDEIALSAMHLKARPLRDILATLVHEMTHHEQQHFGKPSRNGHHNREWGGLMKRVGLHPSSTGAPGGAETGRSVSHYIVVDGPFDCACARLLDGGFKIPFVEDWLRLNAPKRKTVAKTKYVCPCCDNTVWGRPSLAIDCSDCGVGFEEIPPKGGA